MNDRNLLNLLMGLSVPLADSPYMFSLLSFRFPLRPRLPLMLNLRPLLFSLWPKALLKLLPLQLNLRSLHLLLR